MAPATDITTFTEDAQVIDSLESMSDDLSEAGTDVSEEDYSSAVDKIDKAILELQDVRAYLSKLVPDEEEEDA